MNSSQCRAQLNGLVPDLLHHVRAMLPAWPRWRLNPLLARWEKEERRLRLVVGMKWSQLQRSVMRGPARMDSSPTPMTSASLSPPTHSSPSPSSCRPAPVSSAPATPISAAPSTLLFSTSCTGSLPNAFRLSALGVVAAALRSSRTPHPPSLSFAPLLQRTLFTTAPARDAARPLADLREEADAEPANAAKQSALMETLARENPAEAVRRYESQQYVMSDSAFKHYVTSLVKLGRLGQTKLVYPHSAATAPSSSFSSPSSSPSSPSFSSALSSSASSSSSPALAIPSTAGAGGGSEAAPLHVVIQEPSGKAQLWRMLRWLVMMLVLVSAMNQLMDDKALGGKVGMGGPQEVRPDTASRKYTFDDVQGADEAKEELQDVVEFLRSPEKFTRLGGKLPRGILLTGPPGTGKTLLARAVAGEAGVPFFYCSGSEFDEVFVGVGARRVRELFAAAKRKAPCIIFLDEIDAVGGKRSAKDQQYVKMTLNQLLVDLDGFNQTDGIIVVGATNFPELLDPALTRPGRFDTHIEVALPDLRGRHLILKAHARKMPIDSEESLMKIARGTPGFSGAELANLVNQASLRASRHHSDVISLQDLEWAKDKILMGPERSKAVISEKDRKLTAYHEAGHALCALFAEGAVPVYKATIVPRGKALGMVTQLPEDDTNSVTRREMVSRLVVCMGGRAAEERIFGRDHVTSGASSDLVQATRLAHAMVTRYAMSDKVGPIAVEAEEQLSGDMRKLIEAEELALLKEAMERAHAILSRYEKEHHRLAQALLERETLTADEMRDVVAGRPLPPLSVVKAAEGKKEEGRAGEAGGEKEKAGVAAASSPSTPPAAPGQGKVRV